VARCAKSPKSRKATKPMDEQRVLGSRTQCSKKVVCTRRYSIGTAKIVPGSIAVADRQYEGTIENEKHTLREGAVLC
jgi:hypothetical protein